MAEGTTPDPTTAPPVSGVNAPGQVLDSNLPDPAEVGSVPIATAADAAQSAVDTSAPDATDAPPAPTDSGQQQPNAATQLLDLSSIQHRQEIKAGLGAAAAGTMGSKVQKFVPALDQTPKLHRILDQTLTQDAAATKALDNHAALESNQANLTQKIDNAKGTRLKGQDRAQLKSAQKALKQTNKDLKQAEKVLNKAAKSEGVARAKFAKTFKTPFDRANVGAYEEAANSARAGAIVRTGSAIGRATSAVLKVAKIGGAAASVGFIGADVGSVISRKFFGEKSGTWGGRIGGAVGAGLGLAAAFTGVGEFALASYGVYLAGRAGWAGYKAMTTKPPGSFWKAAGSDLYDRSGLHSILHLGKQGVDFVTGHKPAPAAAAKPPAQPQGGAAQQSQPAPAAAPAASGPGAAPDTGGPAADAPTGSPFGVDQFMLGNSDVMSTLKTQLSITGNAANEDVVTKLKQTMEQNIPGYKASPGTDLSQTDVKALQQYMKDKGYYKADGKLDQADGMFGQHSQDAFKAMMADASPNNSFKWTGDAATSSPTADAAPAAVPMTTGRSYGSIKTAIADQVSPPAVAQPANNRRTNLAALKHPVPVTDSAPDTHTAPLPSTLTANTTPQLTVRVAAIQNT